MTWPASNACSSPAGAYNPAMSCIFCRIVAGDIPASKVHEDERLLAFKDLNPQRTSIVLSTAHPAKFPDAVEAACGIRPALPQWLADLDRRRERVTTLPVDPMAVERHILSRSRAAHEGAAA